MSGSAWPLVLIEVVLIFGGVLAFAWWQIRDVRRAQEQARQRRAAESLPTPAPPDEPDDRNPPRHR
jgi:Tfp pilus assembly protein PilV